MKSLINHNYNLNNQLLKKGYFSSLNKKIIFSVYMMIRNELRYKENKELVKSENKNLSVKRIKIEHVFAYIKSYRVMQRLNYYGKDKTIMAKIKLLWQR